MNQRRARSGFTVARIAGIPVRFQWSWFLVTGVIVALFGPQISSIFPDLGFMAYGVALAYALLLMLSVLAHELAHAFSAKAFGWPPTEIELNLWGGHTQFIVRAATPGKSLAVSLAGPAANLVIAGIGWYLVETLTPVGVTGLLASVMVLVNFLVGVFNLLPGMPLDGGRIVESAVWKATGNQDKGTLAAGWAGRVIAAAVVAGLGYYLLTKDGQLNLVLVVVAVMVAFVLWQGASETVRIARKSLAQRPSQDGER